MVQKLSPADIKKILHPTEFSRFLLTLLVLVPLLIVFVLVVIATQGIAVLAILGAFISFWFAV